MKFLIKLKYSKRRWEEGRETTKKILTPQLQSNTGTLAAEPRLQSTVLGNFGDGSCKLFAWAGPEPQFSPSQSPK
jgi:hypothetical protein